MSKNSTDDLKIEAIAAGLTDAQKVAFFDIFWRTWSINGFGTLGKKDTELLIFACLKRACAGSGPRSNYGWAKLLRLTPAKIKTMRLEAHQRFGHLLQESSAKDAEEFLKKFTELQSIDLKGFKSTGEIDEVTVSFVVEDPVVQMEIENDLKSVGSYLDFHRNREVIRLKLIDFFRLVAEGVERVAIDQWVANKAKEKASASSLRSRVLAKEYAEKSELQKFTTFIDDLAEFGKVKVLTDHLKKIFKSQSERKR
jgi:hypothetical protein